MIVRSGGVRSDGEEWGSEKYVIVRSGGVRSDSEEWGGEK